MTGESPTSFPSRQHVRAGRLGRDRQIAWLRASTFFSAGGGGAGAGSTRLGRVLVAGNIPAPDADDGDDATTAAAASFHGNVPPEAASSWSRKSVELI